MSISNLYTDVSNPADPESYLTLAPVASGPVTRWRTKLSTIPLFGQVIANLTIKSDNSRNGFTRVNFLYRKPVTDLVLSPSKEVRAAQARVEFTFAAGSTAVERKQAVKDLSSLLDQASILNAVTDLIPPM